MGKPYWLTGRRALIALFIMVLLGSLAPTVYSKTGADGEKMRELARCRVACIHLTVECRGNCAPQCSALFPPGQQYHDCWDACQESCTLQRKNCVALCEFEFYGTTPEIP